MHNALVQLQTPFMRWDSPRHKWRPITNLEMLASKSAANRRRRERIARRDCTDCEGPTMSGECRKAYGMCVFVQDANQLIWSYEHGEDIGNTTDHRTENAAH
jgi:hypothetical protein